MQSRSTIFAVAFAAACNRSPRAAALLIEAGSTEALSNSDAADGRPTTESLLKEQPRAEATIRDIDAVYGERLAERLRLGGPYERALVLQRFAAAAPPQSTLPTLVELLDEDAPVPLGDCLSLLSTPRSRVGGQGNDYLWAECAHEESSGRTSNAWRARRVLGRFQREPKLGEAIARRALAHPPSAPVLASLLRDGGPVGTFLPTFVGALKDAHSPDAEAALLEVILATGIADGSDVATAALSRTASPHATVRRRAALMVVALSSNGGLAHPAGGAEALARAVALLSAELRDPSMEGVAAEVALARMDPRGPALLVPALVDRLKGNPRDAADVLSALASAMGHAEPALPLLLHRLAAAEPTPLLPELCRAIGAMGERAKAAKPLLLQKVEGAGYDLSAVLDALASIDATISPAEWRRVLKLYDEGCGDAHSPALFGLTREQHCDEAEGALMAIAQLNGFPYRPGGQ